MSTPEHRDESDNLVLGMLAGAGAIFMFTLMNAFAKHLSSDHSIIEIVFFRNLIAMIPFLFVGLAFRRDIFVIQSKPHVNVRFSAPSRWARHLPRSR